MYRIWAVARHMIAESLRQKFALVGVVLIVAILTVIPFVFEGDGVTLTSRVQMFLKWSLGCIWFVLCLVTILLSCLTISDEINKKRIFMIATKPLPRWQFFVGKWLGIGVLNAALLVSCLLAILVATWFLKDLKTTVAGDSKKLQYEVLNARHGIELKEPDFTADIEQQMRRMREEGTLEEVNKGGQEELKSRIREDLKKSWRSIAPEKVKRFEFKDLMVDRESEGFVHLRFKPLHSGGMSHVNFPVTIQCGDLAEKQTLTRAVSEEFPVDMFQSVPIPNWAVNSKGTLYVMMRNDDPQYTYTFEGNDSIELMYDLGTFHWNLFRAMSMIWCQAAFLAAFGLAMSTFLSFPVACMGTFLVFLVSSFAGFLGTAVDWVAPLDNTGTRDPLGPIGPLLRPLAVGFVALVPDFSKSDPDGNVVNGRLVPLMWVIQTFVDLVLVKGLIIAALGCIVLSKRELAQET